MSPTNQLYRYIRSIVKVHDKAFKSYALCEPQIVKENQSKVHLFLLLKYLYILYNIYNSGLNSSKIQKLNNGEKTTNYKALKHILMYFLFYRYIYGLLLVIIGVLLGVLGICRGISGVCRGGNGYVPLLPSASFQPKLSIPAYSMCTRVITISQRVLAEEFGDEFSDSL